MTRIEAANLINKKYPKAKISECNLDVTEEGITVWNANGSKDFFKLDGSYIGHKDA